MRRQKETIVGLVIVVGLAVAVGGTIWLQGADWRRNMISVDVLFRDVGQVQAGNSVRLRGVSIGQVEQIAVEPGGNAVRVRLRIDGDIPLPRDAVVLLAPESLFGDWMAEILPRSRYPLFDYIEITEPGVLSGYSLPDISRLTATADRISENLADLTERVGMAFTEETALNVARAIDNIEDISQQLSDLIGQQAATFEVVAADVQVASREISQAASAARGGFQRMETLLGSREVDSILVDVRETIGNVRDVSSELGATTRSFQGVAMRADSSFARIDRIAAMAESGDGALGRLLTDSTLAMEMESSMAQLRLLLEDIRENPQRYVRLSIF
ncbi:MAG: MlaD family protein [Gemmatimonadota bacterium]